MVEAKIPPITVFFFVLVPTIALGSAVAVLASPEPRSWSFFAATVATWIGLRGASWFMYKSRDDVVKLEKVASANEANEGLLVEHETTTNEQESDSENPQTVYHHVHLYKILQGLMRPSLFTIQVQHASVVSLGIVLVIRMFHITLFSTHPANLEFGPDNVALVHQFDSFTNFMQGGFAAFLSYPAVVGLIARVFTTAVGDSLLLKKPNVYFIWLCEVLSASMTIFPSTITLIAVARNYGGFSTSTHLRKLAEWIVGYALGITGGMYFSCIVQRVLFLVSGILNALENHNSNAEESIAYVVDKLAVSHPRSDEEDGDTTLSTRYGFGKGDEYRGLVYKVIESVATLISRLCQALLAITTFINAMFIGSTWYFDRVEKASITLSCTLPVVVIVTFASIAIATNRAY